MSERTIPLLVFVWICCVLSACRTPFEPVGADEVLRRSIDEVVSRELRGFSDSAQEQKRMTTQPPGGVQESLASRRAELDALGPATSAQPFASDLGLDLTGAPQQQQLLTLQEAIHGAVKRNLRVVAARLLPAISREDVTAAEAVFDAQFFGSVNLSKTDEPSVVPVINGNLIGTGVRGTDSNRYETGLRKRLLSGATVSLSTDLSRSQNNAPGLTLSPDPAYSSAARLNLTQPLLRGFGEAVNNATIRISRNAERSAVATLRSDLLDVTASTESAYWELVFAWHNLSIQQWLVEVGEEVRDVLDRRRDFDTKPAQYSDAVATVEQRKGNVIIARRQLHAASDALKVLINDPAQTIGSEVLLKPSDELIESPIEYNLIDTIRTAVTNRPEITRAILAINDASIRQTVADNLRLPQLDLTAELAYFGLDDVPGSSYANLFDAQFIDYVLGLSFEIPLGNRDAEAGYRKARLERSVALVDYRNQVQQVVFQVKSALRDVIASYELIAARRSFRVAQAENLRALQVEEETMAGLTPEFLNLKFQRQSGLATAREQEIRAQVEFDKSVAELYRAMGIGLKMKQIDFDDAALRDAAFDEEYR